MSDKFQFFNGKKFIRDDSTGYYLCSSRCSDGKRKRMHVYVWEHYNGKVPEGCHIHHIDEDKSNNDISNLALLSEVEHLSLHAKENAIINYERVIDNLNTKARPKASEWHGSEVGREWHKKHYEKMKDKLYVKHEFVCVQCGKGFSSTQTESKFCSNNCKSAYRRASGVDDVVKICENCGGEYTANKYQKTRYCELCRYKKHSGNRKS